MDQFVSNLLFEADDGDNDMEGDADLANEIHAQESGDDIDEDLDFGGGNI